MDNLTMLDSNFFMEQAPKTAHDFIVYAKQIIKDQFPNISEDKYAELCVELTKVMINDFSTGIMAQRLESITDALYTLKNNE